VDSGLAGEPIAATGGLRFITRVEPPANISPQAWGAFGNAMHKTIADWLVAQFGRDAFIFKILPGQRGIDVTVIDKDVQTLLSAKHIEIKPLSYEQVLKAVRQNDNNWGLSEFRIWAYTKEGNVYDVGMFPYTDEMLSNVTTGVGPR